MRREHEAAFEHLRHDLGGACAEQAIELGVVERADDHRQLRPRLMSVVQDLERDLRVGKRDHHRARPGETRREERFLAPRVAVDDAAPFARGFAHALRIRIERDERDVLRFEQPREILAAAPVAADDHVVLPRHRPRGDRRELRGPREPVVRRQPAHDRLGEMDDERRGEHRQHHRRKHDLRDRLRQELRLRGNGEHHQREFAGLGEIETGAQRRAERLAEQHATGRRRARACRQPARRAAAAPNAQFAATTPRIEGHADSDEEEPEQHVAKRLDVLLDLIAVLGLGDQHPGEERARARARGRRARSARRDRA